VKKRKDAEIVPPRAEALALTRNSTGYRGVDQARPGRFRAVIKGSKGVWRSRYFTTAAAAARAYDREARRRYGKLAYLNFPRSGEQRVVRMDDDVCLRGHERALCTYFAPDGHAGIAESVTASRKRAATPAGKLAPVRLASPLVAQRRPYLPPATRLSISGGFQNRFCSSAQTRPTVPSPISRVASVAATA